MQAKTAATLKPHLELEQSTKQYMLWCLIHSKVNVWKEDVCQDGTQSDESQVYVLKDGRPFMCVLRGVIRATHLLPVPSLCVT